MGGRVRACFREPHAACCCPLPSVVTEGQRAPAMAGFLWPCAPGAAGIRGKVGGLVAAGPGPVGVLVLIAGGVLPLEGGGCVQGFAGLSVEVPELVVAEPCGGAVLLVFGLLVGELGQFLEALPDPVVHFGEV